MPEVVTLYFPDTRVLFGFQSGRRWLTDVEEAQGREQRRLRYQQSRAVLTANLNLLDQNARQIVADFIDLSAKGRYNPFYVFAWPRRKYVGVNAGGWNGSVAGDGFANAFQLAFGNPLANPANDSVLTAAYVAGVAKAFTFTKGWSSSTWTSRTAAANNTWSAICWSPELGLYCAVAQTGAVGSQVMTSPDGITWTSHAASANNQWLSVCWSPQLRLFVATSFDGGTSQVMTSPDGTTWTTRTVPSTGTWGAVCWSPQLALFCAVSDTGTNRVMTSPDGVTWTSRSAAVANKWEGVAWSPQLGLFAATSYTGTGNRVMTSPDGITWTSRTTPEDNSWIGIAWSPELSLFAAVSYDGTHRVMTSPDGINWTARTTPTNVLNQWYRIAWAPRPGVFCAVSLNGNNNSVMTSKDGITWTAGVTPASGYYDIAWSPQLEQFAAVTELGAAASQVITGTGVGGGEDRLQLPMAGTAPVATDVAAGGSLSAGTYVFTYTYTQNGLESFESPISNTITAALNDHATGTGVLAGPAGTTKRTVYRSKVGAPTVRFKDQDINDNVTTTFSSTQADSTLGVAGPGQAPAAGAAITVDITARERIPVRLQTDENSDQVIEAAQDLVQRPFSVIEVL